MSACATQAQTNGATKQTAAPSFTPRVDVWETEQEYLFHADMPGVQPGDISLQFENGQLKLHGKVQPKPCCQGKLQNEYAVGDYERQFAINDEVEISKINADYKNGVLTVKLPKKEEVKPKKIEITV